MMLPVIFLGDMFYWLRKYGQNLDPSAALSNSVEPFTPTLIGRGTIGQFSTDAKLMPGFWMAVAASLLIMVGLHYRRAARKAAELDLALAEEASGGNAAERPGHHRPAHPKPRRRLGRPRAGGTISPAERADGDERERGMAQTA